MTPEVSKSLVRFLDCLSAAIEKEFGPASERGVVQALVKETVAAVVAKLPDVPAKPAKAAKFPKSYSAWLKQGEVNTDGCFSQVSCVSWAAEKIELMYFAESAAFSTENSAAESRSTIANALRDTIGFTGELVILKKAADVPAPTVEKKAVPVEAPGPVAVKASSEVTIEQLTEECIKTAKALGPEGRAKVKSVLKDVGGSEALKDVDVSKYPILLETLKSLSETIGSGDEF